MNKKIRFLLTILFSVWTVFLFQLPAEAVWVSVSTSSYTMVDGIGYINPGASVYCHGYHEWPPYQTTTFTFTNGINSYSATGANGTGKGGDFGLYMGPFAPGTNYRMYSSNGGFINFSGPFTVGYPDSVPPYNASLSCTGNTSSLNITLTGTAMDNVGVTQCCIFEGTSSAPVSPPPIVTWQTPTSIGSSKWRLIINLTASKNTGIKYFYAWFKDAAGNMSTRAGTTFNVTDSISPTGSFTISQPAGSVSGYLNSANINLILTASDVVSDVTHYYIFSRTPSLPSASPPASGDSIWLSLPTPYQQSYSGSQFHTLAGSDGSKEVFVWYKDAAGNVSAASNSPQIITLDTKAPIAGHEGDGAWQHVGVPEFSPGIVSNASIYVYDGLPYVSFEDNPNGAKATVMKFDGTSWGYVGSPGFTSALAYLPAISVYNGVPYIAFEDNACMKATVMKFNGTNWNYVGNQGFSAGFPNYLSFYLYNGTPYVAYGDTTYGNKVTVMKFNGTNWVNVGNPGFSAGSSPYTSLYVYNGTPYVVYGDYAPGNGQKASVMKFDGTNWVYVGNPAFSAGFADFTLISIYNGIPYVVYMDGTLSNKLTMMAFNGTAWINIGAPGFSSTIPAIYSHAMKIYNGTPYVAYTDSANSNKITVMKFDGTNWIYVGNPGFSTLSGDAASLDIFNGTLYVAYRDAVTKANVMKFDETINDGLDINNGARLTTTRTLKMKIFGTDWHNSLAGTGIEKYCIKYGAIPLAPLAGDSVWLNMPAAFSNTAPTTQEVNFTLPSTETDGLKIFYLWFKDKAGNVSSAAQKSIKFDEFPPVEAIAGNIAIAGTHPELLITREVMLQLNAESGQDTVEGYYDIKVTHYFLTDCNLGTTPSAPTASSAWAAVSSPVTPYSELVSYRVTSPADGTKEIYVWYKDVAGNMSLPSKCVTFLDTSIPHGSFTINGGAEWSNSPLVTLNLTAISATAVNGYFISTSSAAPSATDNGWRVVSPPVGSYAADIPYSLDRGAGVKTIYVWFKSTSSIVSAGSSGTIKLDCEPPEAGTKEVIVKTFAGPPQGSAVSGDADGFSTAARFKSPYTLAIDNSNNLYVTDQQNNKIRKISPSAQVKTFAGPNPGSTQSGDTDGPNNSALFNNPNGIAVDSSNDIYVCDSYNRKIRKISTAGIVSTFVGPPPGTILTGDSDGNSGSARFGMPVAIAIDSYHNIFIGDDTPNSKIRKIDQTGYVTTYAGPPPGTSATGDTDGALTNARFTEPHHMAIDHEGNIILTDYYTNKIRKIVLNSLVTTFAGPDPGTNTSGDTEGPVSLAKFKNPQGVDIDSSGNIFIADSFNHKIRKISTTGIVTTFAGPKDGSGNPSGDADGNASNARFNQPIGLKLDKSNNIYICDYSNNKIRKISTLHGPGFDINGGEPYTNSTAVKLNLAATDDYSGVNSYFVSESPIPPNASSTWLSITFPAGGTAEVNHTISTLANPVKLYLWYRDAAGNISPYSSKIINPRPMKVVESYGSSSVFNKPFLIAKDSNENLIVADKPAAGTSPLFKLYPPAYSTGGRMISPGSAIDKLLEVVSGLVLFKDNYIGLIENAKKRFVIFNAAGAFVNGFAKSVDMISNYHGFNTISDTRGLIYDKYTAGINPFCEARVMANQATAALDMNLSASTIEIFTDAAFTTPLVGDIKLNSRFYLRLTGSGGDGSAINSIIMKAKSSDDPKGISVQLIETGLDTNIFTGSIAAGQYTDLTNGLIGAGPKNMIYLTVYSKSGILHRTLRTKPKPPSGPVFIADLGGSLFIEMVRIPAGTFVMGQTGIATPTHEVTLTKDFYMGKYEITQAQWLKVMGALASATKPLVSQTSTYNRGQGDNYPVYLVSWNDICNSSGNGFMTKINAMNLVDGTFRLPTEAEWEYACRSGTTSTYYWGEDASEATMKQYCWYNKNAYSGSWTVPHATVQGTQIVGQKLPNAFGLYDISGNVWEWCNDWYGSYSSTSVTNPVGPATGVQRIVHGGAWSNDGGYCCPAFRFNYLPANCGVHIGFRLVLAAGQ